MWVAAVRSRAGTRKCVLGQSLSGGFRAFVCATDLYNVTLPMLLENIAEASAPPSSRRDRWNYLWKRGLRQNVFINTHSSPATQRELFKSAYSRAVLQRDTLTLHQQVVCRYTAPPNVSLFLPATNKSCEAGVGVRCTFLPFARQKVGNLFSGGEC